MCFVATFLHIDIPTPLGKTMIHLGNVMCLLSGMILGPLKGGLSAGLGSAVYDLFDPAYIAESPITFLMKFAMGATCGAIAKRGGTGSRAAGAVVGAGLYVVDVYKRQRLDGEEGARRVERFLRGSCEEIKTFCRICGHRRVDELSVDDLCTLDEEIARHGGIRHA